MPNADQTLVELLESSFAAHAHATANRCMGVDCSFESLEAKSRHLAAYLQGLGLQYPDRVAVMMPNLPQHPIAIAGVIRAGLVLVEMSPLLSSRELSHQLKDCGARAVIVLENFGRCLAEALSGMKGVARVLYPYLDSHPQAALSRKQMKLGGTMVTFEVEGGKAKAFDLLRNLGIIDIQIQRQIGAPLPTPGTGLEEHQIETSVLKVAITPGSRGRHQYETIALLRGVERLQQIRHQPLRLR